MNTTVVKKILRLIAEANPSICQTYYYGYISRMVEKDGKTIAYAEKMYVKEGLRVLCSVSGLSYERLLLKVCLSAGL
jgi:hypothetical protein